MKNNKLIYIITLFALMTALVFTLSSGVFAEDAAGDTTAEPEVQEEVLTTGEEEADGGISAKAIAAALCVGVAGAAGAIAMGMAISKSTEGMARQPEAASQINGAMMLGLVFIETAIIYALIIAILIIFVL